MIVKKLFFSTFATTMLLASSMGFTASADSVSTPTATTATSQTSTVSSNSSSSNETVKLQPGETDPIDQEAGIPNPVPVRSGTMRVVKRYIFDRGATGDHNFHDYHYITVPSYSHKVGYQNYRVGGGWNYVRYEHINYWSGGY